VLGGITKDLIYGTRYDVTAPPLFSQCIGGDFKLAGSALQQIMQINNLKFQVSKEKNKLKIKNNFIT
jgi:hypothetical protein